MTAELRLECLKLAMEQARREQNYGRKHVAEIAAEFYSHITGEAEPESGQPEKAKQNRGRKADKPHEIFS